MYIIFTLCMIYALNILKHDFPEVVQQENIF